MLPINYPIPDAYRLHALVLALLLACTGWILYRFGVRIAGFALGFLLGGVLGIVIPAVFERPGAQLWTVPILGVLLGWFASVLVVGLFRLLVFLAVALASFFTLSVVAGAPLTLEAFGEEPAVFLTALGVSLLLGLCGVLLQRYLIIVLTVWIGASLMQEILPHPATFPAVVALGLFVQLGFYRRLVTRAPREES
ncbi:hypothetical protein HS125_08860 [bacterium]|nr:hypothetical protein [bacterium]